MYHHRCCLERLRATAVRTLPPSPSLDRPCRSLVRFEVTVKCISLWEKDPSTTLLGRRGNNNRWAIGRRWTNSSCLNWHNFTYEGYFWRTTAGESRDWSQERAYVRTGHHNAFSLITSTISMLAWSLSSKSNRDSLCDYSSRSMRQIVSDLASGEWVSGKKRSVVSCMLLLPYSADRWGTLGLVDSGRR